MRKPNDKIVPETGVVQVTDEKTLKRFPLLLEYMTTVKWEDGSDRETSTVSVFVEDGQFKAALNDRACRRSAYVTAGTLELLFAALEGGLAKESLDWRSWGKQSKKKG